MSWKKRPEHVKHLKKSTPLIFQISLVADDVEKRQKETEKKKDKEREEDDKFNLQLRSNR